MDDLSSVEWTAPKAASSSHQYPHPSANHYPALRPTPPISGRSTPSALLPNLKLPANTPGRSNSSTPANDSFANLVSFHAPQSSKALSLQDQQKRLQEDRARQEAEKTATLDTHFGATQAAKRDISDGRTTPNRIISPPTYTATEEYGGHSLSKIINKPFAGIPVDSISDTKLKAEQDEENLLAAFDASARVDKLSHMPDASSPTRVQAFGQLNKIGLLPSSLTTRTVNGTKGGFTENNDYDPFGLGIPMSTSIKSLANPAAVRESHTDDDDVLGLLGRPVSEFSRKPSFEQAVASPAINTESHPQEHAIAELVDMGFTLEKSRVALEATESGTDVQAAVGWLLRQAHEDSRRTTKNHKMGDEPSDATSTSQSRRATGRRKSSTSGGAKPAWMRDQGRPSANQSRTDNKSPKNAEKDPAQYASELGNKVFKTAGSLWKTGTKKLNQAVQEFNSDSDSNQPKWMKDAPVDSLRKSQPQHRRSDVNGHEKLEKKVPRLPAPSIVNSHVTDEALMLEGDSRPPARKTRVKANPLQDTPGQTIQQTSSLTSNAHEKVLPQPKFMQQEPSRDPKFKLSRQAVEDESSQAYISPARRKRLTAKRISQERAPDLLLEPPKSTFHNNLSRPTPDTRPQAISSPSLPSRPAPLKRSIPPLSSFATQTSTKGRQEGNSAFKRGDYAQATLHYSSALSAVPITHPLTIVLLTNRALSHSKTGDPKASMADTKSALDLIGPSRGVGETIDLDGSEGTKQMSNYWEKAMTRQAEALEHLERWTEAAAIWRTSVEAGVGGSTSIAGRNRCEKAAAPPSQAKPAAPKGSTLKPRPKATAFGDFAPDPESVTRLRAANAAAERLDDEKFALTDIVDQRVSNWRAGKEGNLRALLSTLENVLWQDSGWKKVGMGDVLLPGKVKLVYMKGIAKVHPDKLPTTATTEQRMVSAAVFAALNDAWERFKIENGL